jgi:hypothetical protein
MKKNILTTAILLILAGMISCGKDKNDNEEKNPLLDLGIYIETYPTKGRTRIDLIDREKLAIIKDYGNSSAELYYKIIEEENTIIFFQLEDPSDDVGGAYFKVINASKFEISYLYFALAYGAPKIMTFEKEKNVK